MSKREFKGPSALWIHFVKAGIHDTKFDIWQRGGHYFKKLPNLYLLCPPEKKAQKWSKEQDKRVINS